MGDCSLTALHMARCLSELDRAAPEVSARDVRRQGHGAERPRGGGERSRSIGAWLRHLGLEQYREGLYENGWDDLEFFRDVTEQDLLEAGVLSPTHRQLIRAKLRESRAEGLLHRAYVDPRA